MSHQYAKSFHSKIKLNKKVLLLGIYTLLYFAGCRKFVTVDLPVSQLATKAVFNNSASATAAVTNIYQQMYLNLESVNIALFTGCLGDELSYLAASDPFRIFYTNSMDASKNLGPWTNAYNYIYQSNAIIENLKISDIPPTFKRQLIGEALFVRAFWHFYLMNHYGDVPVVTTTDYSQNSNLTRSPRPVVFKQIVADLQEADGDLATNYIDASDTTITIERTRPNQAAAEALLARVFLYSKNYDSAEARATQVINNPLFRLESLDSVFLANSSEAIWQMSTPLSSGSNNGIDTWDGYNFILTGASPLTLSHQLLSSFEAGDQRRVQWVDSVVEGIPLTSYYFPYKYKIKVDPTPTISPEYTMVLRLAEQYLIRAEARAQDNDISGAQSDLNMIRSRAGLDSTMANDRISLLNSILHERQVELFTEWGHRWFDIIRTNSVDSIMGPPGNLYQLKGGYGNWSPNRELYPIPQSDRLNDPHLTQNVGY